MTIRDRANVIDTSRISLRMLIIANAISEANCSRVDFFANVMFSTWFLKRYDDYSSRLKVVLYSI